MSFIAVCRHPCGKLIAIMESPEDQREAPEFVAEWPTREAAEKALEDTMAAQVWHCEVIDLEDAL